MNKLMIGLSGKAGSGKTLARKLIVEELINLEVPEELIIMDSFANPVRKIVAELTGCTTDDLLKSEFKNKKLPEKWTKYKITSKDKDLNSFDYNINNKHELIDIFHSLIHLNENIDINVSSTIPTYRDLLRYIGTDVGRNSLNKDIWVDSLDKRFTSTSGEFYIIDDVRFLNEVNYIKDFCNGVIININDKNLKDNSSHESETSLDSFDDYNYIIENTTKDLNKLRSKISFIINDITTNFN